MGVVSDHVPHNHRCHEALHPLVRKAVEHRGLVWEHCHHEDRCDGLLLLAPPMRAANGLPNACRTSRTR
jgi:hypothetical protein